MLDTFDGDCLLADTSAWCKIKGAPDEVKQAWARALHEGRIVCCAVVQYELTMTARDHRGIEQWTESLARLRHLSVQASTFTRALRAVEDLSSKLGPGEHRVPLPDALIAATASNDTSLPVLHYDHHFDRLAKVLPFESRPIAGWGSIS